MRAVAYTLALDQSNIPMRILLLSLALIPPLICGAVLHGRALGRIEDHEIARYLAASDLIAPITVIAFIVLVWHLTFKISNAGTRTYLAMIAPALSLGIYAAITSTERKIGDVIPFLFSPISSYYAYSILIGATFVSVPVILFMQTKRKVQQD